jgi:uncharacterized small protein (DUF1192 family)
MGSSSTLIRQNNLQFQAVGLYPVTLERQVEEIMSLFDEEPRRKIIHDIGQDLSLLSVSELDERIALLRAEITRLEEERSRKGDSKVAAEALFR